MSKNNGVLSWHPIQFISSGVSFFCQFVIVVAGAEDRLPNWHFIFLDVVLGILKHLRDGGDVSEGSRGDGEVEVEHDGSHTEMRMSIHKARQHCFIFEVDVFGPPWFHVQGVDGLVADSSDFPIFDSYSLGRRELMVHGEDVAVIVDGLGLLKGEGSWLEDGEGESEGEECGPKEEKLHAYLKWMWNMITFRNIKNRYRLFISLKETWAPRWLKSIWSDNLSLTIFKNKNK